MENQEIQNNSTHSIKWGVISGVISILITLIIYIVDISLFTAGWVGILMIAISIFIVFYASIDYRKLQGGFMTFGQAFLHAFALLAIAGLLDVTFRYLLFNIIDPEAAVYLAEKQLEATMKVMESFGAGGNTASMDGIAKGFQDQYKIGTMAIGYATALIVYAVGASIVGAITKKKNQETDF
ncbi:MAG: hypothetical protein ACJAT1_000882 [Marivirga sp.]|jgi:hypothetical protein